MLLYYTLELWFAHREQQLDAKGFSFSSSQSLGLGARVVDFGCLLLLFVFFLGGASEQ